MRVFRTLRLPIPLAERFGIPAAYADVREMLAAERPELHLALTRAAPNAGVHVICQKPMAPSMAEAAQMVETCEARGVRLLIHENWRWQPWYREVQRLMDGGAFGRLFHLGFRMRTGDGRGTRTRCSPIFARCRGCWSTRR